MSCINFERLPCNCKHSGPVHITPEQFKKGVLALVSCTWQNYWMQIGWDRAHFCLILRARLVIKRAWLLDADWLSAPTLSWFPASNGFWKGISETHRFWIWSRRGYFVLTWKKIDMQQSAKGFFHPKMSWLAAWKKVFYWGRLVSDEAKSYRT